MRRLGETSSLTSCTRSSSAQRGRKICGRCPKAEGARKSASSPPPPPSLSHHLCCWCLPHIAGGKSATFVATLLLLLLLLLRKLHAISCDVQVPVELPSWSVRACSTCLNDAPLASCGIRWVAQCSVAATLNYEKGRVKCHLAHVAYTPHLTANLRPQLIPCA